MIDKKRRAQMRKPQEPNSRFIFRWLYRCVQKRLELLWSASTNSRKCKVHTTNNQALQNTPVPTLPPSLPVSFSISNEIKQKIHSQHMSCCQLVGSGASYKYYCYVTRGQRQNELWVRLQAAVAVSVFGEVQKMARNNTNKAVETRHGTVQCAWSDNCIVHSPVHVQQSFHMQISVYRVWQVVVAVVDTF